MSELNTIIIAAAFMAAFGIILSLLIILANKKFLVHEDPRIDEVEAMLPHANCGACGTAGCRAFAEQLVQGQKVPAQCTVSSKDAALAIARYLGVSLGKIEKRVARLACAGGNHVAILKANYAGLKTCRAAALVAGGGKACAWGCIGLGDCESVCDFGAIHINRNGLPQVDTELCTACGDCVDICPKRLFEIHPISHRLWVSCKNQEFGDAAEQWCEVACTACERCAMDAPEGLIQIHNNLATIDYSKNALASPIAIQRCPTGAIVWLNDVGIQKGRNAKKVIRKEALPIL